MEKNDKQVKFAAFSKLFENDMLQVTTKHINQLFEKQNFTNLYLTILGEEMVLLHDRMIKENQGQVY